MWCLDLVIPLKCTTGTPIETIWSDGIFKIGRNKIVRTYKSHRYQPCGGKQSR